MSETRIVRARRVQVKNPDPNKTISLAAIVESIISRPAAVVPQIIRGTIASSAMSPVTATQLASVSAQGARVVQAKAMSMKGAVTIPRPSASAALNEIQTVLKVAPYVAKSSEQAIRGLMGAVIAHADEPAKLDASIKALRHAVTSDHEKITAEAVFASTRDSLAEMHFSPITARAADGYILARQGAQGPVIRVDVRRTEGTGVMIETDADGFHGESCQMALNQLEAKLRAKGFDLAVARRRPKRNSFAATRIALRQQ